VATQSLLQTYISKELCDTLLVNKGKGFLVRGMKTLGGSDWATTRHSRFIPLPPLRALQTPAPSEWVAKWVSKPV